MNILSYKEEQNLTRLELKRYYEELREYLKNTQHENLSPGSLTVCKAINPVVREVLYNCCGYEIKKDYSQDIKGLNAIYAHTHQSKMDHVNFIATNPNHTILLNSVVLSELYKMVLRINGVYFVDKSDKHSQNAAKLEMIRLLLNGQGITIFPESAWNCSPNKLHLPLRFGIIDIARKAKVPIIPVVQEYTYDERKLDGIERIILAHIKYGKPIYVNEGDNIMEKLEEYSEAISTMRWELIEEKGRYNRQQISGIQYNNYLDGIIRNLEKAGINIDVERQGIFGADDEFYKYHHINAAETDAEYPLPTEKVKRLVVTPKRKIFLPNSRFEHHWSA